VLHGQLPCGAKVGGHGSGDGSSCCCRERAWKLQQAKKFARHAQRSDMDIESRAHKRVRQEQQAIRKVAAGIAKEVSSLTRRRVRCRQPHCWHRVVPSVPMLRLQHDTTCKQTRSFCCAVQRSACGVDR